MMPIANYTVSIFIVVVPLEVITIVARLLQLVQIAVVHQILVEFTGIVVVQFTILLLDINITVQIQPYSMEDIIPMEIPIIII